MLESLLDLLQDPGVLQTDFQRAGSQVYPALLLQWAGSQGIVIEGRGATSNNSLTFNHLGTKELKSSVRDRDKGVRRGQRFNEHFRNGIDEPGEGRQSRGSILQSPRFVVWGTRWMVMA